MLSTGMGIGGDVEVITLLVAVLITETVFEPAFAT
jgi:hypothetical protein